MTGTCEFKDVEFVREGTPEECTAAANFWAS